MSICRHNKSYVPQKIISIWSRERSHTPTSRLDVSKKKKKSTDYTIKNNNEKQTPTRKAHHIYAYRTFPPSLLNNLR